MKLAIDYYLQDDVVALARDLIGKVLVTKIGGAVTSGIIAETEAYSAHNDRASHAWNGRKTRRNAVMYARGGAAYVYLCYGMHSLFNVVTNKEGVPDAVLIRAVKPLAGLPVMEQRLGRSLHNDDVIKGPGNVSKLMAISLLHSGIDLTGDDLWIEYGTAVIPSEHIKITPRIGIAYAGSDALLPWRFVVSEK